MCLFYTMSALYKSKLIGFCSITLVWFPDDVPLRVETWINVKCDIVKKKIYRVSIKSFPDYKHLLQENYVEYKHIFFFFQM